MCKLKINLNSVSVKLQLQNGTFTGTFATSVRSQSVRLPHNQTTFFISISTFYPIHLLRIDHKIVYSSIYNETNVLNRARYEGQTIQNSYGNNFIDCGESLWMKPYRNQSNQCLVSSLLTTLPTSRNIRPIHLRDALRQPNCLLNRFRSHASVYKEFRVSSKIATSRAIRLVFT